MEAATPPARVLPDADFHRRAPPRWVQWAVPPGVVLLVFAVALTSPGENPGAGRERLDPRTGEHVFEHTWSPWAVAAIGMGVAGGYLLLASPLLIYKRPVGALLGRRRHRIHAWFGAALLALAAAHAVILPLVGFYEGWLSGVLGLALLALHGATGLWKARLIRSWGAARWAYGHAATAWAALAMTLFHSLGVGWAAHAFGTH